MNNVHGILLVVFAMAAFAVEDLFVKQLSVTMPVGQVLLIIGGGSSAIFLTLVVANRQALFARVAWTPVMLTRVLCDIFGSIAFVTSLSLVDLSTVAAVFQATPLAVTMGAALFLGDPVGWRRWSAVGVGFFGVLLIIRPGFDGFDPAALWVLGAVLAIATRDLLTRKVDPSVPSLVLSFQGSAALLVAGLLTLAVTGTPVVGADGVNITRALAAIFFGTVGYYGLMRALRLADPSAIAPFRYSRLIFSLILGVFVLGEAPDALTLLGALIVITTGLYTFLRERRVAQLAVA